VHDPLQTVVESADPNATAAIAHISLVNGMTEVTLLARPGTTWGNIVQQYGLVPMSSVPSKDFLAALAPLEVLCELGKDPRVSAVSLPIRPTPAAAP
jgi:hypothetical protein